MVNLSPETGAVKNPPLLTLTTDFGLCDPFVGIMKGVILGICPTARVVDLVHRLPAQGVLDAYLAVDAAHRFFPPGTLHLVVVDPGVGTDRAVLWARTATAQFLAPDNGVLSFLRADEIIELRRVENTELMLSPVSRTFHGRDVFAPVAAHLARGVPPSELGPGVEKLHRLHLPAARVSRDGVAGEILTFDRFGNAVTNIRETDLPPGALRAEIGQQPLPVATTYADVAVGEPLALIGSSGRLEVSVRDGDARRTLDLAPGTTVRVGPA